MFEKDEEDASSGAGNVISETDGNIYRGDSRTPYLSDVVTINHVKDMMGITHQQIKDTIEKSYQTIELYLKNPTSSPVISESELDEILHEQSDRFSEVVSFIQSLPSKSRVVSCKYERWCSEREYRESSDKDIQMAVDDLYPGNGDQ